MAKTGHSSKTRLQAISHHFLSAPDRMADAAVTDSRDPYLPAGAPRVIPFVALGGSTFPVKHLARTLLARGRSTHVLAFERGRQDSTPPIPSASTHRDSATPSVTDGGGGPAPDGWLNRVVGELNPLPQVCLLPMPETEFGVALAAGRVMLAVPAHRDGIRAAYRYIKIVHGAGLSKEIGIVLMDATSTQDAAEWFTKLSQGVRRFLDIALVSYSCLPPTPNRYDPVDLLEERIINPLDTALDGIAALIIGDLLAAEAARV